jgi:hypothetical protein
MPGSIETQGDKMEIHVSESDTRDLRLLDPSDIVFAILYSVLFVWGLCFTIASI